MRRILLTLALTSCLAAPASAGDLVLGAESDFEFDSNVYGESSDEVSDFLWTVAPTFQLTETTRTLTGVLNFVPTYEYFIEHDRLSGFNYDADASLEWQPSERTTFTLADSLMQHRALRGFQPGSAPDPNPPPGTPPGGNPVLAGRESYLRNVAQFGIAHRTSPTGTLQLGANYGFWDFQRRTRVDQNSLGASLQYFQLVAPKTRVGGAVSFSRQAFEPLGIPERHTDYYNASVNASYVPAETFFVRASVGPTYVRQQAQVQASLTNLIRAQLIPFDSQGPQVGLLGTCPLLPSGDPYLDPTCDLVSFPFPNFLRLGDPIPFIGPVPSLGGVRDSWTYFADVAIDKHWEAARAGLSYRRDQGSASSIGYSTIADTISLYATYQPIRRLNLSFHTVWENRFQTERGGPGFVTVLGTLPATATLPAVNNLVPVGLTVSPLAATKTRRRVSEVSVSLGADYSLTEALHLETAAAYTDRNATRGSFYEPMERLFVRVGFKFDYEPFRW